jgi:hypothetical protein
MRKMTTSTPAWGDDNDDDDDDRKGGDSLDYNAFYR